MNDQTDQTPGQDPGLDPPLTPELLAKLERVHALMVELGVRGLDVFAYAWTKTLPADAEENRETFADEETGEWTMRDQLASDVECIEEDSRDWSRDVTGRVWEMAAAVYPEAFA